MNKQQQEKIKEIKSHPDFVCRAGLGFVKALEDDVALTDADILFKYVVEAYTKGEPKRGSGYIKRQFKKSLIYFTDQLSNLDR